MIEVFDTAAARCALARRKLRCPDCGQALRPWGRARERTIRELGGAVRTVRPDRPRCTGCAVTHVVLDAGLLPRHSCTADLVGQALVAAAQGRGHRLIARDLAVPCGTVRGWIRRARRSAGQLWAAGGPRQPPPAFCVISRDHVGHQAEDRGTTRPASKINLR